MRSRTTVELFQYWNDVRGNRVLPRRDEIQPGDIRSLLPNVFILQTEPAGGIYFRLAGTNICSLFGNELRHRQFSSLWRGDQQEDIGRIARQAIESCTPIVLAASGATAAGDWLDLEILMTPLASRDGKGDRVLGALSPLSGPMWLHMMPLQHLMLEQVQENSEVPEMLTRAGNTVIRLDTHRSPIRRAQHLPVFEGGRRN
ncbi:PAS domain-containing protein [Sinorhizobium medicae]|nr:PAS domain-containing protein [Sinorhizobium medicae]MDX0580126.1 PAS domain-containing protein [Sinorhizobium medicae]MDX0783775.1 PAS domain-containing protein [Sinorhizobium medicae]